MLSWSLCPVVLLVLLHDWHLCGYRRYCRVNFSEPLKLSLLTLESTSLKISWLFQKNSIHNKIVVYNSDNSVIRDDTESFFAE